MPALPLVGGGSTKFQPVCVDDVAAAVVRAVEGHVQAGKIYELGGANIKSFRELLEINFTDNRRKRLLLPLPFFAAKIQAFFMQLLPKPLLTVDQVRLLEKDNVVSEAAINEGRTLAV